MSHFNKGGNTIFDQKELEKTLIIDDQIGAVYNRSTLVLSKKYIECVKWRLNFIEKQFGSQAEAHVAKQKKRC